MKKFISVLLVMVMTCSLLAGCSQEGGQTEKEEETTQQEAGGEEEETTKEGGYTIGCVIINDANTHCMLQMMTRKHCCSASMIWWQPVWTGSSWNLRTRRLL